MSRTDKTKPMHLRALMRPEWVEEHHDHSNGRPCDLPPRATEKNLEVLAPIGGAGGYCAWTTSPAFWGSGMSHCGCPTCQVDNWDGRGPRKRVQRREGRQYARDGWQAEF